MDAIGYTVEEIETIELMSFDDEPSLSEQFESNRDDDGGCADCDWLEYQQCMEPSLEDRWARSEGFSDFDVMLDITGLTHEELRSCIPASFE